MEGVKYITKIEKLTKLGVKVIRERTVDFREVIVQLAGQCPALKTFISFHVKGDIWFLAMFGRTFPEKKLTFTYFEATESFDYDWPQNLLVEDMNISGTLNDETVLKVKFLLNYANF